MTCSTCTPQSVAHQQGLARAADAAINKKFGRYMAPGATQKKMKVEVLDEAAMRDRWAEVRVADWQKKNPPPKDPAGAAAYAKELQDVRAAYGRMAARLSPEAFAYGNTAYVSPKLGQETMTHEILHNKANERYESYILQTTDSINANKVNESLTEHFNRQLTAGVAAPGSPEYTDYRVSEYGTGAQVMKELRDERLGGPVAGEEVLRKFFFGGDTQGFEAATAGSGGPGSFFDEYRRRTADYTHEAWKKTLK